MNPLLIADALDGGASQKHINEAEAHEICDRLMELMDQLNLTIEEETRLIREGELLTAGEKQGEKSVLAVRYINEMTQAQNLAGQLKDLVPEKVEKLRREHEGFRSILQINLSVLATAQDVSQTLIDSVADAIGATENPTVYGRDGAMSSMPKGGGLAVNTAR